MGEAASLKIKQSVRQRRDYPYTHCLKTIASGLNSVFIIFFLILSFISVSVDPSMDGYRIGFGPIREAYGYDSYISSPAEMPFFSNYSNPEFRPGESGVYSFTIYNRYRGNMSNLTLTAEIYRWADKRESLDIIYIDQEPEFQDGAGTLIEFRKSLLTGRDYNEEYMGQNKTDGNEIFNMSLSGWRLEMRIKAGKETPVGTYFIRHTLSFQYGGTLYAMKSRGYYTTEEWANASQNASSYPGGINLTYLRTDGVIPDSAFGVKVSFPVWPKYMFFFLALFCLIAAFVFYIMEEKGKLTTLRQKLYFIKGKTEVLKAETHIEEKLKGMRIVKKKR